MSVPMTTVYSRSSIQVIVTSCKMTFRRPTQPINRPCTFFPIQRYAQITFHRDCHQLQRFTRRIPNCGMESASCMTAMGPSITPRKLSRLSSAWIRVGSFARSLRHALITLHADFDKANEILFRLGIIYKQQAKYRDSLACFDKILRNPPNPLAHADIWFQIGHVYEQEKDVGDMNTSVKHF